MRRTTVLPAGIPDAPTGADRAAYLAAIKAVDPGIVEDEEKAIDAGRNQCSHLATPNDKSDWLAAQRSATTPGRAGQGAERGATEDALPGLTQVAYR